MKIEKLNDDNYIVFLNRLYIGNNNFELKKDFEEYFKNFFKILNSYYNIDVIGYYDIQIFCDNLYGYVLEIKREQMDFYDYYHDHIDMKIIINDKQKFIYKMKSNSTLNKEVLKFCYLRKLNNEIYLIPKKTITQIQLGNLLENSDIVYGDKALEIQNKTENVRTKQIFV